MKNKKVLLQEQLKSHVVDIFVMLLIASIGFMIFQSKKHEKESAAKIQINTIVNDFKNIKTR